VNNATYGLCQPIWLNPSINRKVVLNEKWQEKIIIFLNYILNTNGNAACQITYTCMFYNSCF